MLQTRPSSKWELHCSSLSTRLDYQEGKGGGTKGLKGKLGQKSKIIFCRILDADSDGVCPTFVRSTGFEILPKSRSGAAAM